MSRSETPTGDVDAEAPESAASANNRRDDAETCAAVAEETGEPCGNPAILGTGRCHMHLDYTELAAAESTDETAAYTRNGGAQTSTSTGDTEA